MKLTEIYPDGESLSMDVGTIPLKGTSAIAHLWYSYGSISLQGNEITCEAFPDHDEQFADIRFALCEFTRADGTPIKGLVWMLEENFVEGKKCTIGREPDTEEGFMSKIVDMLPWKEGCLQRPRNFLETLTKTTCVKCVV